MFLSLPLSKISKHDPTPVRIENTSTTQFLNQAHFLIGPMGGSMWSPRTWNLPCPLQQGDSGANLLALREGLSGMICMGPCSVKDAGSDTGRQEGQSQSPGERLEDAVLLPLKMTEGDTQQGLGRPLESGEGEEMDSPGACEGAQPALI